jgi:DNA-binding response OmpR family regulator
MPGTGTRADPDCEAIIIAGQELSELREALAEVRAGALRQLLIAAVPAATSADIAALLRAGADDVFTPAMSASEADARCSAHMRRYFYQLDGPTGRLPPLTRAMQQARARMRIPVSAAGLFSLLASPPGQLVPYADLLEVMGRPDNYFTRRSLQVLISRLRRELPEGIVITGVSGRGYVMTVPQPGDLT